jgi:cytochrome c peroxidase
MKPVALIVVGSIVVAGCGDGPAASSDLDIQLREALATARVTSLQALPAMDPAIVRLGQVLMFDKVLSGNRDVSCATCHNPTSSTSDGLSLSIGTGGAGTAGSRVLSAASQFVPRNSPDLFNRGFPDFVGMFWDGRVSQADNGDLHTPAGTQLPAGLSGALAAQAMFPVTTRLEMRGHAGDVDRLGSPNELAQIPDEDPSAIWLALMNRLLAIPEYVSMFRAAYPTVAPAELGFQHAANAIAAFETAAFTAVNTPFDRYLQGDDSALSEAEKQGAVLFFGRAGCGSCHLGPHLTDQRFHSIGVPQVGPGFAPNDPEDRGRERVTGGAADRYRFRTPPLRNVEITGPYMHDGAYTTLEAAVRHYLNTGTALRSYDASQLREDVRGSYVSNPSALDAMAATLDIMVQAPLTLNDAEVGNLVSFLKALTDPASRDLSSAVPGAVPSGLPVGD